MSFRKGVLTTSPNEKRQGKKKEIMSKRNYEGEVSSGPFITRGTAARVIDTTNPYHVTARYGVIGAGSIAITYVDPTTGECFIMSPPQFNARLLEMFQELTSGQLSMIQEVINKETGNDAERTSRWLECGEAFSFNDFREPLSHTDLDIHGMYTHVFKRQELPLPKLDPHNRFLLACVSLPHFMATFTFEGTVFAQHDHQNDAASISSESKWNCKDYWSTYIEKKKTMEKKESPTLFAGLELGFGLVRERKVVVNDPEQYYDSSSEISFNRVPRSYRTLPRFKGELFGPLQLVPVTTKDSHCTIPPMVVGFQDQTVRQWKSGKYDMPRYRKIGGNSDLMTQDAMDIATERADGTESMFNDVAVQ